MKESEEISNIKKAFIGLVLILIILAISYILILNASSESPIKTCESLLIGNRDSCLLGLAESTNNASICNLISNQTKPYCYMYFANKTGNITYCKYLTYNMKNTCIYTLALEKDNITYCSFLNNPTQCITNMSLEYKNITLCNYATNQSLCKNVFRLYYALNNKNVTYCYMLNGTVGAYKNYTKNLFLLSPIAGVFASSNSSIPLNSTCIYIMSQITNNTFLCRNLGRPFNLTCNYLAINATTNFTIKNLTLNSSAILEACNKGNIPISACSSIINLYKISIANTTSDCFNLTGNYSSLCLASLAYKYKNSSICYEINNTKYKNLCLMQFYNFT